MNRKAVLVFAAPVGLDLARRKLPRALQPLLSWQRVDRSGVAADLHLFTSGASVALPGFQTHAQRGATFAERLENATQELARLGYEEIVLVGSDCPSLHPGDVAAAFRELAGKRLVLGPDHRGGCYLIALRTVDRHLLQGVRWNRNSDYAQLRERVAAGATTSLSVKQDVDNWADVRLLARAGHRLALLIVTLFRAGQSVENLFVDLSAQAVRARGQIPPPAFAA